MAKVASAKRHAQALFQIASEHNNIEGWQSDLEIIESVISDPELASVLENPKFHLNDKIEIINKSLPQLSQIVRNFVGFLVAKQRLAILGQIVIEYKRMADAHRGLEHAVVTTAIPLEKADEQKLASHLAEVAGKQIVLSTNVDPIILGGFVARIGDKLIDGSTRSRLDSLKGKLVKAA